MTSDNIKSVANSVEKYETNQRKVETESCNQPTPVVDEYYACYALIYATACVNWLPITFILTAYNYWMYKLGDRSSDNVNKNYYQKYFYANSGSIQQIGGITFILIIYISKYISFNKRLCIVYGTILGGLAFTVTMVKVDTRSWQQIFYYSSISVVGILTVAGNLLYVLLLELTAKFPPKYLGFIEAGNATANILSAVMQIFCLQVVNSPETSGIIYFSFVIGYIIFSILFYIIVTNTSKFYKERISMVIEAKQNENISLAKIKSIFWKVKIPVISFSVNMCISMMIHPGITMLVVSKNAGNRSEWNDVLFSPVVTCLLPSVVSVATRFVTLNFKQMTNQYILFIMCIARIGLIPFVLFCNAQPRNHLPVQFEEDYYFIIFVVINSSSDCFLNTTIALLVPRMCESDEIYLGNIISVSFQNVTLFAMSYINVVLVKLI